MLFIEDRPLQGTMDDQQKYDRLPFYSSGKAHCFSFLPNWYLPTIDNYEQQIADISCSPDRKMKPTYQERNIYQ